MFGINPFDLLVSAPGRAYSFVRNHHRTSRYFGRPLYKAIRYAPYYLFTEAVREGARRGIRWAFGPRQSQFERATSFRRPSRPSRYPSSSSFRSSLSANVHPSVARRLVPSNRLNERLRRSRYGPYRVRRNGIVHRRRPFRSFARLPDYTPWHHRRRIVRTPGRYVPGSIRASQDYTVGRTVGRISSSRYRNDAWRLGELRRVHPDANAKTVYVEDQYGKGHVYQYVTPNVKMPNKADAGVYVEVKDPGQYHATGYMHEISAGGDHVSSTYDSRPVDVTITAGHTEAAGVKIVSDSDRAENQAFLSKRTRGNG